MLNNKYKESNKFMGLFLIGLGVVAILFGFLFYLLDAPGMFLGLYAGPVLFIAGAIFMIIHKE